MTSTRRKSDLSAVAVLALLLCSCGKSKDGGHRPDTDGPPPDTGGVVVVLATASNPIDVAVRDGEVFWSDASSAPIKKIAATGGNVIPLAHQLEMPAAIAFRSPHLFWIDRRGGISASGCSGNEVIAALVRASIDGTDWSELAIGDACLGAEGPVLGEDGIYWVTSTASPPDYMLQHIPDGGGTPTTLRSSQSRIKNLTTDGTDLYWFEGSFPEPGAILRMPVGGGTPTIVAAGTEENPLHGLFTIADDVLFFVELGDPYPDLYRISKMPLSGGPATLLVAIRLSPFPERMMVSGGNVYWSDGDRIQTVPLKGGPPQTIFSDGDRVLDFLIRGTEADVATVPNLDPGVKGRILRIWLQSGESAALVNEIESPHSLTTDGENLYWVESDAYNQFEGAGRIARIPLAGGVSETLIGGFAPPPRICLGDDRIWASDKWCIKGVPFDGGVPEILVRADDAVICIASESGNVYATIGPFTALWRIPIAGGALQILHPGTGGPPGPVRVLDDGFLYWLDHNDTVWRVPQDGGTAEAVASGMGFVRDFVTDGNAIFCYENDSGEIRRVPIGGGATTSLALGHVGADTRLALDGSWLYWVDPWGVSKVPIAGGEVVLIEPLNGDGSPSGIALDSESIFVTDAALGLVLKITPK